MAQSDDMLLLTFENLCKNTPSAEFLRKRRETDGGILPIDTVMVQLAKSKDKATRITMARTKILPPEAFEILARDPDWHVRSYLTLNPELPKHIRQLLADDKNPYVRSSAKEQIECEEIMKRAKTEKALRDKGCE